MLAREETTRTVDRLAHRRSESAVAAVIFGVATVIVAAVGATNTDRGMEWYDELDKPGFTPRGAAFGIVWTILFVVIAVAGWLAWRATASPRPTISWAVQMALNLLWTVVFFGLRSPGGAVVVVGLLIVAVVINLQLSAKVLPAAGMLLFPYLVWCGFAAALNIGVVVLNR